MSGKTPAIIPRSGKSEHMPAWQVELAHAVRSGDELLRRLEIEPGQVNTRPWSADFPLRVPRGFVRRMRRGDPRDPLLLQVLPVSEETELPHGYCTDPLREADVMPVPGLLHKYHGRALLTVTGACAVHCRYCFRRHFPYLDANPAHGQWTKVVDYLAAHPEINELILSGGDPLSLTDNRLQRLTSQLAGIDHLRTLRIHTRIPIVLPARIDAGLLEWLAGLSLRIVMVVHCNHPNEIDDSVSQAMQRLGRAGVTLLNQSVLLRDVNDAAETLVQLSQRLFADGVLPYYLHQLDRVQGAAHFEVDDKRARELLAALHGRLPGYLVPRLVREVPGEPGKRPL
ncbi:MAG: EF-P beta-lysylation protein EpmB [Gammaproteobacteria bacterium]